MYGLQGFFSKIVLIVRIFKKDLGIVRFFSKIVRIVRIFFRKLYGFFLKMYGFFQKSFGHPVTTIIEFEIFIMTLNTNIY